MANIISSDVTQRWVEENIRVVQNFPKRGIGFFDITSLFGQPDGVKKMADGVLHVLRSGDCDFNKIVAVDSRGFLIGSVLSMVTSTPLILARKSGKLPNPTTSKEYSLEYGKSVMEIQNTDINSGDKALVVDDILATGGTCKAVANLIEDMGAKVSGLLFLIVIDDVYGGKLLEKYDIYTLSQLKESSYAD